MAQNPKSSNGEVEIDLQKLLFAWLQKWWLIVACTVVCAAASLIYARFFITPTYRASASLIVNNYGGGTETENFTESQYKASQTLASGYVAIIKSHRVLGEVADRLGGGYTVKKLSSIVTAEQSSGTPILKIHAVTTNPETSALIANTVADVAPAVVKELLEGGTARIMDPAETPTTRYAPNYTKYLAVGGLLGLVAALGYLTLTFLLDVRIKDEEELAELSGYPILGQIPDFTSLESKSGKHGYGYGYGRGYSLPNRKENGEEAKS